MKKKIKKLQKSSFMTGVGLTKTKKPLEIKSKAKEKDVVVGIPKKNVDEVIRYILPNEVPETLRESLFKKMSIMKYAKKIYFYFIWFLLYVKRSK